MRLYWREDFINEILLGEDWMVEFLLWRDWEHEIISGEGFGARDCIRG